MLFRQTTENDVPILIEWIRRDLDHAGKMSAEWWKDGTVLSCCIEDDRSPVLFIRLDSEGAGVRLHVQFAPEEIVSRLRAAKTILKSLPVIAEEMKYRQAKAIVFESVSNPLVKFMNKLKFRYWRDNDYVLNLSEEN